MDVTEAPPGTLADTTEQDADDLLMLGWAAPAGLPDAARRTIREQAAVIAELARRNVDATEARDAALDTAARHEAEARRLGAENRGLRGRVAYQGQTIGILREQLAVAGPRKNARPAEPVGPPWCACLEPPDAPVEAVAAVSGRRGLFGWWSR